MNETKIINKVTALSAKDKLGLALSTRNSLATVEDIVRSKFNSQSKKLNEISSYLFSLGGKRIRPILTILMAQSLGDNIGDLKVLDVAAGIELIHMATLLHDDIIDKSPLRRHEESPWIKYGTADTLLAGDFLLTRAYSLCARLDSHIITATENACIELTEGEISEVSLNQKSISIEESLEISRKKTGSLFRLACESAAHLVKNNPRITELAASFGENLGIAFQILDDILDIISTEDLLGKKSGIDIIERKPSSVNIYWLKTGNDLAVDILLSSREISENDRISAISAIKKSTAIAESKLLAEKYVKMAKDSLNELNKIHPLENRSYQALLGLTQYVTERMT